MEEVGVHAAIAIRHAATAFFLKHPKQGLGGATTRPQPRRRGARAPCEEAPVHTAARRGWSLDGAEQRPAPLTRYSRPQTTSTLVRGLGRLSRPRCCTAAALSRAVSSLFEPSWATSRPRAALASRRPCTTGGPRSGLGCAGPNRCTWRPRLLAAGSPSRTRREPGRRVAACASPSEPRLAALG